MVYHLCDFDDDDVVVVVPVEWGFFFPRVEHLGFLILPWHRYKHSICLDLLLTLRSQWSVYILIIVFLMVVDEEDTTIMIKNTPLSTSPP